MTVVRITIKKVLHRSFYQYGRAALVPFSSEYLVRTNASFLSDQLDAYAKGIALAESRLHPTSVVFDYASVKLSTPGASSEELRGHFSHISLNETPGQKMRGQWQIGEDDALAFPFVSAVYVRQTQWGRNGRLLIPHVITGTEWNLYHQKQVEPLRFQGPDTQNPASSDQTPALSFSQELIEAIRAQGGTYVMPGGEGENDQALPVVTKFVFMGFQVNPSNSKRKKAAATRRAAQRRAFSLNPRGEPDLSPSDATDAPSKKGAKTKEPVAGLVYLLKSGPHFKIGKTINFEKRLGQIKLLLPDPVEVVHTIRAANPSAVESHWHRRFAALRRGGEWFVLSEADVAEFKSVSQM